MGAVTYRERGDMALESRLEIMDVTRAERRVVFRIEDHIEAPNWSRDGAFLIYNSGGLLYRFDLATGACSLAAGTMHSTWTERMPTSKATCS